MISVAFTVFLLAPPADAPAPAEAPPTKRQLRPEFSAGVQAFLRPEARYNADFSGPTQLDAGRVLSRARLQGGVKLGVASAFVQAQDARVWGQEASTTSNEANLDLHQGYMQFAGDDVAKGYIRAGRQEINWGNQRLIGALPWLPGARSFDAVRAHGELGRVYADGFASVLSMQQTFSFQDDVGAEQTVQTNGSYLYGAQVGAQWHEAFGTEVSFLLADLNAIPSAPARARTVSNLGGRAWGKLGGLRYDAEYNGQFGEVSGRRHLAWAGAADVSYTFERVATKPGLTAGYAIASGDRCTSQAPDCGTTVSREFFNFFPTNHIHYGLVDLAGWRNIRDLEFGVTDAPLEWMKLSVGYHYFQLHESTGRWSNAGGANVGLGWDPSNEDHELGHEIDATITVKPIKPVMLQPGYGVFIPSGAGTLLGGSAPQHFAYLWAIVTFDWTSKSEG